MKDFILKLFQESFVNSLHYKPCKNQLPSIIKTYNKMRSKGRVQVVLI